MSISESHARQTDTPNVSSPSTPEPHDSTTESRMNRIAKRAHQLYEARGGQHGTALEDWLSAEREIDLEIEHR